MNKAPHIPAQTKLIVIIALALSVLAAQDSLLAGTDTDQPLADFDLRSSIASLRTPANDTEALNRNAARTAAVIRLENTTPGLRIDWDPLLDTPLFLRSRQGFLTSPNNAPAKPIQIVNGFVTGNPEIFGLGIDPLRDLTIVRNATTMHNGMRTIWLQQNIRGIPILGCDLRANVTKDDQIATIGSRLLNLESESLVVQHTELDPVYAINSAVASLGIASIDNLTPDGVIDDRSNLQYTADQCSGVVRFREFYIPFGPTDIRRGARVTLQIAGDPNVYEVTVVGDTHEPVIRRNLALSVIEPATYRVFENSDPTPLSPGPPFPNEIQPLPMKRSLITIGALDPVASPEGWIPPGVDTTVGNNVAAQTDQNFDNVPDLPRPLSESNRVFDFPFTPGAPPESNMDAAVTQAFYMGNWFHDVMYGNGFTESFGNYQDSNFDRGGVGHDPLQIDVLDGGGENNARFISNGDDGSEGRVELFLWDNGSESRNSAFDNQVLLHELAHSLSIRLHGGLNGIQAGGMGEGWSDFLALALLSRPGDNLAGVYPIGSYLAYTDSNPPFLDNYYFGIRRYPYSIDFNVNPLTFSDIDPQQFDVGIEAPRNPLVPLNNPGQVHRVGEIWCGALWECRAELIQAHGFDGNAMMLRLVTDAMKLTTTSEPNMVIGRDAILLADLVNNNGENLCLLWDAFARRGLGTQASSPADGLSGIVESFHSISVPALRLLSPAPTLLAPGEQYPIMIAADPGCDGSVPVSSTQLLVSVNGSAYQAFPAIAESSSIHHAVLPSFQCGDRIDYYFSIEFDTGIVFDPPQGDLNPYQANVEINQSLGQIRASDPNAFDFFGFDVDISGNTVVVGAFQDDENGFDSGAVYLYDVMPEGDRTEISKLTHPTSEKIANYGYSVAVSRDTLAVGAIGDDLRATNAGAAYVYKRIDDKNWALEDTLLASDGEIGDRFGTAIDTDGNLVIVGSPGNDTSGLSAGAVYVYLRVDTGQWQQEKRILAMDGHSGDSLGQSVSLSENVMAIGAPGQSLSAGAVYLYRREASGEWALITKLTAPVPIDGAFYGSRVHLHGDQLIVAAINDTDIFQNVGAAYVYRDDPDKGWVFEDKLTAPDQRGLDEFGSGVAIEDDLAFVGARRSNAIGVDSGATYSYLRNSDGSWDFASKIIPEGIQPRINLGNSLALDQGVAIVGAWTDGEDNSITGAAYLIRPVAIDCDGNGIADTCDIAAGDLSDLNNDGIPDRCQCSGDLNGDRMVNTADLGMLINQFGNIDSSVDLNFDGLVDQVDLALLLFSFGLECTPDDS